MNATETSVQPVQYLEYQMPAETSPQNLFERGRKITEVIAYFILKNK